MATKRFHRHHLISQDFLVNLVYLSRQCRLWATIPSRPGFFSNYIMERCSVHATLRTRNVRSIMLHVYWFSSSLLKLNSSTLEMYPSFFNRVCNWLNITSFLDPLNLFISAFVLINITFTLKIPIYVTTAFLWHSRLISLSSTPANSYSLFSHHSVYKVILWWPWMDIINRKIFGMCSQGRRTKQIPDFWPLNDRPSNPYS